MQFKGAFLAKQFVLLVLGGLLHFIVLWEYGTFLYCLHSSMNITRLHFFNSDGSCLWILCVIINVLWLVETRSNPKSQPYKNCFFLDMDWTISEPTANHWCHGLYGVYPSRVILQQNWRNKKGLKGWIKLTFTAILRERAHKSTMTFSRELWGLLMIIWQSWLKYLSKPFSGSV